MYNPDDNELERAIIAADLRELLANYSAQINSDIERIKLSPLTIYCSKTGAPIGTLNRDTLETALRIHGRERCEEIILTANITAHALAWRFTDSTSLDKLIKADPQGYAVFAFDMLCNVMNIPKHLRKDNRPKSHWALARAWQYLSLLSPLQLDALCDNLCACLTFAPDTVRFMRLRKEIVKSISHADEMAKLALDGTLIPILEKAVEDVMETLHRWDMADHVKRRIVHKVYEDLPRTPADAARGPSNVRGQKRARVHVERQNAIKIETEFSLGLMQFMQEARLPKANWIGRKINAIKAAPLGVTGLDLSEISELEAFAFDELPTDRDDDEDDNTVEVRTISREELRSMRGEQITPKPALEHPASTSISTSISTPKASTSSTIAPSTPSTPIVPTLSIRERIARNIAKQAEAAAKVAKVPVQAPKSGNAIWARLQARKNKE